MRAGAMSAPDFVETPVARVSKLLAGITLCQSKVAVVWLTDVDVEADGHAFVDKAVRLPDSIGFDDERAFSFPGRIGNPPSARGC